MTECTMWCDTTFHHSIPAMVCKTYPRRPQLQMTPVASQSNQTYIATVVLHVRCYCTISPPTPTIQGSGVSYMQRSRLVMIGELNSNNCNCCPNACEHICCKGSFSRWRKKSRCWGNPLSSNVNQMEYLHHNSPLSPIMVVGKGSHDQWLCAWTTLFFLLFHSFTNIYISRFGN